MTVSTLETQIADSGELTSPTTVTRPKRPRNATTTQRKPSASATPAATSTASKRRARGRGPKKEEEKEEDEQEHSEEGEEAETESVAESASVADTDGGPLKGLRASSRRKGGQDEAKSETSTSGRGGSRGGDGKDGSERQGSREEQITTAVSRRRLDRGAVSTGGIVLWNVNRIRLGRLNDDRLLYRRLCSALSGRRHRFDFNFLLRC